MACGRSFLFVFSFLHRRSFRVVASMKSAYEEEEDSEEVSPDDDSDDDVTKSTPSSFATTVFKTFVTDNASSFFTNT